MYIVACGHVIEYVSALCKLPHKGIGIISGAAIISKDK